MLLLGVHNPTLGAYTVAHQQQAQAAGHAGAEDAIRAIVERKRNLALNIANVALFRLNMEFADVSNAGGCKEWHSMLCQ
jgi:hypothetical protein